MVSSISAILGFLITFLLGFVFIPYLKKLHFGQTILEIGPAWHKEKQGTPIMGGLMFIIGTLAAVAVVFLTDKIRGYDSCMDILKWYEEKRIYPIDVFDEKIYLR